MPNRPEAYQLIKTDVAPEVLNAIRNSASQNYRDYVPYATPDAQSIKAIGAIIMDNPALQNEFINSLVNRIALVVVKSRLYENPLRRFKKGVLEFGETIEEVFVNIAHVFQFDPENAENKVFERVLPDVKSAFHVMNYQKFYKVTISDDMLRTAFTSYNGIENLIAKITEQIYTAANYDEFLVMKYMVAKYLANGRIAVKEIEPLTKENIDEAAVALRELSNDFIFKNTDYNIAGVLTDTDKAKQVIIMTNRFSARFDVTLLAVVFNMEKADVREATALVDSFAKLDTKRLAELFDGDPNYTPLTQDELTALDKVDAVLVDEDWFQVYDRLLKFTEIYNPQGLYWNYNFHTWKTFSVSPFAQAVALVEGTPSVESVTITPQSITDAKNGVYQFAASVKAKNFAPQSVTWSAKRTAGTGNITIDEKTGKATVSNITNNDTFTVTATSTFDNEKKAEATISAPTE